MTKYDKIGCKNNQLGPKITPRMPKILPINVFAEGASCKKQVPVNLGNECEINQGLGTGCGGAIFSGQ